MIGQSFEQARAACRAFLASLPALPDSATFNVLRFGTTVRSLFKSPVGASVRDQGAVVQARELFDSMQADMGGSQLKRVLKELVHPMARLCDLGHEMIRPDPQHASAVSRICSSRPCISCKKAQSGEMSVCLHCHQVVCDACSQVPKHSGPIKAILLTV